VTTHRCLLCSTELRSHDEAKAHLIIRHREEFAINKEQWEAKLLVRLDVAAGATPDSPQTGNPSEDQDLETAEDSTDTISDQAVSIVAGHVVTLAQELA
jgi:hypothetical protein